jgi:NodT family efflux transporter outer membrane factor (OMF) lipoprotein
MKRMLAAVAGALLVSACAVPGPRTDMPETLPVQWYAPPLPHQGQAGALTDWWAQLGDPALAALVALAQERSASVAGAQAQVAGARAALAGAESAGGPQLAAVASASRGLSQGAPLATGVGAGVQASWALDVWGQNAATVRQADAQVAAANAGWHAARVLVAAETARLYHGLRACRAQLQITRGDRESRRATADSAALSERAGLTAPAVAALARASHADAEGRLAQQTGQCEQQFKAMVALTGEPEPALRERLGNAAVVPDGRSMAERLVVAAVPAEVIRQRPDVARAQQELVAAAEGVGAARAALWPSLSLSGSWLRNRLSGAAGDSSFNTWSVGPLTLSLPLIGRSGLNAAATAAQARYEASGLAYAATLRQAVAEVEQTLVALAALEQQQTASRTAVAGYTRSFEATQARYRVGLANLNELEEARRLKLNADSGAVALQLEQLNTWIGLYLALGGGFDPQVSPEPARKPS